MAPHVVYDIGGFEVIRYHQSEKLTVPSWLYWCCSGRCFCDTDEADLADEIFRQADEHHGSRLVRRGRPKAWTTKQLLAVRYDKDIVEAFKATGKGWQSRMNDALRDWLKAHHMN